MLKGTSLDPKFSLDELAHQTEGYSGSDLKELCRNAAMVPVREYLKEAGGDPEILEKSREEVCVSLVSFIILILHSPLAYLVTLPFILYLIYHTHTPFSTIMTSGNFFF